MGPHSSVPTQTISAAELRRRKERQQEAKKRAFEQYHDALTQEFDRSGDDLESLAPRIAAPKDPPEASVGRPLAAGTIVAAAATKDAEAARHPAPRFPPHGV